MMFSSALKIFAVASFACLLLNTTAHAGTPQQDYCIATGKPSNCYISPSIQAAIIAGYGISAVTVGGAIELNTVAGRTMTSRAQDRIYAKDGIPNVPNSAVLSDGNSDDGPRLNAIIAWAGANGKGEVVLDGGITLTSQTIALNQNGVVLVGQGDNNGVNPATSLRWIGPRGGTVVQLGNSPTGAQVFGSGIRGVYVDCGPNYANPARRGIYAVNWWNGIVDAFVNEPAADANGVQPVAYDFDGGTNITRSDHLMWRLQASPTPASATITPGGSYTNPAFPVGLWFHSPHGVPFHGGDNPSYGEFSLINATQTVGVPVLVDWADHLTLGIVDLNTGNGVGMLASGVVVNNAVSNVAATTASASTTSVQSTDANGNPLFTTTVVLAPISYPVTGTLPLAAGWGFTTNNTTVTVASVSGNTVTLTSPASFSIAAGAPVTLGVPSAAPGGIRIREYQGALPIRVMGAVSAQGVTAPQGILITQNDSGNGTPSPVIGSGAQAAWSDDYGNHTTTGTQTMSALVVGSDTASTAIEQVRTAPATASERDYYIGGKRYAAMGLATNGDFYVNTFVGGGTYASSIVVSNATGRVNLNSGAQVQGGLGVNGGAYLTGGVTVLGGLTSDTANVTGNLSGTTAAFSGLISAAGGNFTGPFTATSISLTGALSGVNATFGGLMLANATQTSNATIGSDTTSTITDVVRTAAGVGEERKYLQNGALQFSIGMAADGSFSLINYHNGYQPVMSINAATSQLQLNFGESVLGGLAYDSISTKVGGVPQVGVSCSAGQVNLSTMIVSNGIVTHC